MCLPFFVSGGRGFGGRFFLCSGETGCVSPFLFSGAGLLGPVVGVFGVGKRLYARGRATPVRAGGRNGGGKRL